VTGAELPAYAHAFLPSRYDDPEYQKRLGNWEEEGQLYKEEDAQALQELYYDKTGNAKTFWGLCPMGTLPSTIKRDTIIRRRRNEKDHSDHSNDVAFSILQRLGDPAWAL
jgi:hypothetical protein